MQLRHFALKGGCDTIIVGLGCIAGTSPNCQEIAREKKTKCQFDNGCKLQSIVYDLLLI